jgi:hypothetical protein
MRMTWAVVLSPPSSSTARVTEFAGDFVDVFVLRDDGGEVSLAHFVVQAVGAEDQYVVRPAG